MPYLNLGCGSRFSPEWTNIDFVAQPPHIIGHNLLKGIPFGDECFDVVYHSHILEHFSDEQATPFLQECSRVLKPQGVMRIAVPDLEQIARLYLMTLDLAALGDPLWQRNHDWMLIELYDQMVRERSGGRHGIYLSQTNIPNLDFVMSRQGGEVARALEVARKRREVNPNANSELNENGLQITATKPLYQKTLLFRALRRICRTFGIKRAGASLFPFGSWRELVVRCLLGREYELLQVGRFRRSGEIHQRMYDRYSLAKALHEVGLQDMRQMAATESDIPDWSDFCLDTEDDGRIYKPDSLYMEAVKPR